MIVEHDFLIWIKNKQNVDRFLIFARSLLAVVELIMAFEGEFGTQIPYEEAEKIITVQSAIDYMTNIVGENV